MTRAPTETDGRRPQRGGLTLIEIVIGGTVILLLLVFLSRMLSQGLRSSVKGASHLTNLQAGALLLAHLETDLLRARAVTATPDNLRLELLEDVGPAGPVCSSVIYEPAPNGLGLRRIQSGRPATAQDRVLAAGLRVTRIGGQPFFAQVTLGGGRFGVQVRFEIATDRGGEPFRVEKFVFCGNAPANLPIGGWQRP